MGSLFSYSNYRSFLNDKLLEKTKKNSALSMRAVAEDIGISPSHFSRVLAGKKKLSLRMAHLIALKLNLSESETAYFNSLVELESSKDSAVKSKILQRIFNQKKVSNRPLLAENFRVISGLVPSRDFMYTPA